MAQEDSKKRFNDLMDNHLLLLFAYGSVVYDTQTELSDTDFIGVVDDSIDFSDCVNGMWEYQFEYFDYQFVNESTWIQMIKNHHIHWLECYPLAGTDFIVRGNPENWMQYFTLDKWKMRQVISQIANNSWAKCHKKLVVEKDYDLYRAQKSLFHCLRLLMFGWQIGKYGKITDYKCANEYWHEIRNMCSTFAPFSEGERIWQMYNEKYKPLFNHLRSKMVEVCPKPEGYKMENQNKNKKK